MINILIQSITIAIVFELIYYTNGHSLIAALIKSPWWKILSFLCLYKIKTCQIAVCNNLLLWNEIIVYHFTMVDLSTMVKWNQRAYQFDSHAKSIVSVLLDPVVYFADPVETSLSAGQSNMHSRKETNVPLLLRGAKSLLF